jgi:hypothetical protein
MTRQLPSLTGPQWIQGQSPRLSPLWLQGPSCLPFSLSWQSFTMSRALYPGIRLLRCLRHPSHTLAFSRPLTRQGGIGLPKFHGVQRIEIPVAACCRPGAVGITYRDRPEPRYQAPSLLGQVYQPLSPVGIHGPLTQVPLVSIGIRSGRSTCLWLLVAELLSLGFPPSRVPLVNAGQVDLTPLFMCSSLCEQSIRHVKWRGGIHAGDSRLYVTVDFVAQSRPGKSLRCSHTRSPASRLTDSLPSPPSKDGCGSIRGVDRDDRLHVQHIAALTAIAYVPTWRGNTIRSSHQN